MEEADASNTSASTWIDALGGPPVSRYASLLVAERGVGKSALLAQAGLDALARGQVVLHVSLDNSVEEVRVRYDLVFRENAPSGVSLPTEVERRLMVLSYTGRAFEPAHLASQLHMMVQVAQYRFDLLVIDDLPASWLVVHRAELDALVDDFGVAAWLGVVLDDDALLPRMTDHGGTLVHVAAADDGAHLKVHQDGVVRTVHWSLDVRARGAVESPGSATSQERAMTLKASACTLYSGGATGSEAAFGEAAARYGLNEVNFTFDGHRQARVEGRKLLGPRELEAGDVSLVYVSRRLHRTYNEHGLIRKVLQTLWHMVSRSNQVFVIGAIQENGTVVGGTGWSVELARMWRKELWVFDQDRDGWFHWDGETWTSGVPEIRATTICGTGTRYLEDNGQAAIDALFEAAFGEAG